MKDRNKLGSLEQVRAARHRISKQFGHDPKKLVEHYMEVQQAYSDRLLDTAEQVPEKAEPTAPQQ